MTKTALITGATDGVGRVVARALGKDGWRVLAHGRDAGRGASLVREIEGDGGMATFLPADLASLAEVRRLAAAVHQATDRLDLLINNAGIGTAGAERQTSADGHELRFAVNYLAGFLLTYALLPLLKAAAPSRIVNVSSAGQQAIDFSDVMLTRRYSGRAAYCQSKLAQILFTIDLAEELKGSGVIANALHPSTYMNTTMVQRRRRVAHQQGRDRRRGDPAARRLAEDRGQERPLLQRHDRDPRRSAGLRRRGAPEAAGTQPGADGPRLDARRPLTQPLPQRGRGV